MKIEMATTSDIPTLCTLLDYLFSQEVEFKSDHETQSRGLEMILNNNNSGNIFYCQEKRKNNWNGHTFVYSINSIRRTSCFT